MVSDKDLNVSSSFFTTFVIGVTGVEMSTKSCSLRVVILVLLIFSYLMGTSYTSVLVSRLTVADFSYHLPNMDAIPTSSSPFLCVRTNSAVYSTFQVHVYLSLLSFCLYIFPSLKLCYTSIIHW